MKKIRVALIEDEELSRLSLRITLAQSQILELVGEAKDGLQGLKMLNKVKPDIAIIDIGLPRLNGIQLTKRLKSEQTLGFANFMKVLILTLQDNEESVLAAFAAGADSYCMKNISSPMLIEALKVTSEGNSWLDPAIAKIVLNQAQNKLDIRDNLVQFYDLSERELDVLKLIVDGKSNAEIAEKLFIGVGTVKSHVRNILAKLSANDRTQAAVYALRSGLIG